MQPTEFALLCQMTISLLIILRWSEFNILSKWSLKSWIWYYWKYWRKLWCLVDLDNRQWWASSRYHSTWRHQLKFKVTRVILLFLSLSFRRCKTGLYFIVIYLLIIVMLILLLRKFAVFVLLNIYCYFFIPRWVNGFIVWTSADGFWGGNVRTSHRVDFN